MLYVSIIILFFNLVLFAHTGEPPSSFGFLAGLKHPVLGLDHLLAMLCVGMISSRIGNKAIWQVPTCFVVVMAMGCVLGFYIPNLSIFEPIISLSVVVFGALFLVPQFLTYPATFITVATFSLVHGIAHGKEMPIFVLPEMYISGFMISTIVIHIVGVGIGELINKLPKVLRIAQITGSALIISGTLLLINSV